MGHYYRKDGTAAHFCGPNGSATTLREARKFGLLPSVTEILRLLHKEKLEEWKRKQTMSTVLRLPEDVRQFLIEYEDTESPTEAQDERFAELWDGIEFRSASVAREAADEGKQIHSAIEASFAKERYPAQYRPHVSAVHQVLSDNFHGVTDWAIERCFASSLGFGGCVDISSAGERIIGDHKGAAIAPDEVKRLAYDQNYQLGGYSIGLGFPAEAVGFNLFISRTHPGHVRFHQWSAAEMAKGRRVFQAALDVWKAVKDFNGEWT